MVRPSTRNGHIWMRLWCAVMFVTIICSEALSEAELDIPLDAHNTELLGGKILNKLRGERVPLWHSADTGIANLDTARESLQLISIDRDTSFVSPVGIKKWLTVKNGRKVYGVGLAERSVTLLTAHRVLSKEITFTLSHVSIEFPETVTAAATFTVWHPENSTTRAYAIVASGDTLTTLSWYLVTDDSLLELWKTPIKQPVKEIAVATISSENLVLILSTCTVTQALSACQPGVNIYQFHPWSITDIKLSQSILTGAPAGNINVGTHRDEVLVSIPVPALGKVFLYRHIWPSADISELDETEGIFDNLYGYFKNFRTIDSEEVTQAVFFQQNTQTLLAVSGLSRAVYKITDGLELIGCSKLLNVLGNVLSWAVIPVPSYRDDVLILAQYEQASPDGKNTILGIAALSWLSGAKKFALQEGYSCHVMSDRLPQIGSATCLLEIGGLAGTATLPLGSSSFANLLVPNERFSALVRIHTKMIGLADPVIAKVDLMNDIRSALEAEIAGQERIIHELEGTLLDTLRTDGNNIITGSWVVNEVKSSLVEVQDASSINEPRVVGKTASDTWSKADFKVNLQDVSSQYLQLQASVESVKKDLEEVIIRKEGHIEIQGLLTVLGGLEIDSESTFELLTTTTLNGESTNALLQDAVRLDSLREITGHKSLPSLEADNVIFSSINNIPASQLIFDSISDYPITIQGSVHFNFGLKTDHVSVSPGGKVNGIDISKEVFVLTKAIPVPVLFDRISVENVQSSLVNQIVLTPDSYYAYTTWGLDQSSLVGHLLDSVEVDGNVFVDRVNGEDWGDLLKSVVWTDQPATIPGWTSIGKIVSNPGLDITDLNGLPFPEKYVVRNRSEHVITGNKLFNGGIYAADVDTYTINDIKVDSLVTLHSDQALDGSLTLSTAYFGSDIKVDDKLNGVNIEAINKPSTLLGEGNVITANVDFGQLQVDGPIVVLNTVESSSFADIVSDIVVVPESNSSEAIQPIIITGDKSLLSLSSSDLTLTSGLVNNLPIDGFVTTNTEQVFKKHILASNHVDLGNVDVTGLWDGVPVRALKENVMTVSGNQKITGHLTFTNPSELWANRLNIDELNYGLTDETVLGTFPGGPDGEHDVVLSENGEVTVDGPLGASEIEVGGNIIVKGLVCGVKAIEFEDKRFSLSKPQVVSANMKIDHLKVQQHFNLSNINHQLATFIQNPVRLPTDFEAGGYYVQELDVYGDISTSFGVNRRRFDQLAADAIRLDYMNEIEGSLVFKEPVYFGMLEVHNNVNGLDLSQIEADAVLKDQDVVLRGHTTFWQGLTVAGNLDTNYLFDFNPANVLTKNKDHVVKSLRVNGDVYVTGNVEIDKKFNNEDVKKIAGRYKLLDKDRHQIIGDIKMSGRVTVDDLIVHGNVNGQNIGDFFSSTVDRFSGGVITANLTFRGDVSFVEPVSVEGNVNDIDLSEYYQNLVLTNGNYTEIESPVVFENTLSSGGVFIVEGDVNAGTIYGCNVSEWYNDGVRIDEEVKLQGNRSFEDVITQSLDTPILNAVDFTKVILLRQEQSIPANLYFEEITAHRMITVQKLINNVDLKAAYQNTLLTKDDFYLDGQEIAGKTFTGLVIVDGNLNVQNGINNLDVAKAVTLDTDQVITGPLMIQSTVKAISNVSVSEPISDIDVVLWSQQVVFADSSEVQHVTAPWNILGKVTFLDNVDGNGLLNGHPVSVLEAMKQDVHNQIVEIRANLTKQWETMCLEVNSLAFEAKKQPFLLHQIDVVQGISTPYNINSVHIFKDTAGSTYLFISYLYSCYGALHQWSAQYNRWLLVDHQVLNGGGIAHWLTVHSSSGTYLVTSADYNGLNCSNYGGRVWKFSGKLENGREIEPWSSGSVNGAKPEFYIVSKNEVRTYFLENGEPRAILSRDLKTNGPSYVMARSSNDGLLVKDGSVVTSLENTALGTPDAFLASLLQSIDKIDEIAVFTKPDGKRLVAVFEKSVRSIMIHNLDMEMAVGRISTRGARWITPLELGDLFHPGQTHIAFIEGDNVLRVLQYKGEQGFVEMPRITLPIHVYGFEAVRLPARGLLRERVYLVVRGLNRVLTLEVEMLGDPLPDEPPSCSRNDSF